MRISELSSQPAVPEYLEQQIAVKAGEPSKDHVGMLDGWLLFLLAAAILEGMFSDVLTPLITDRSIPILALTPFNLWPSDMLLLPLSLFLVVFTASRQRSARGSERGILLLTWWGVCMIGVLVGILNRNPYLPADIRNFAIRSIVAFTVYRLALNANLRRVFDAIISFSVVVAIVLIVRRISIFGGLDILSLPIGGWGTQCLLLPYGILLMQVLNGEKKFNAHILRILILAAGILQEFWKPVVIAFLLLHVIAFLIPLRSLPSVGKLPRTHPSSKWRLVVTLAMFGAVAYLFLLLFSDAGDYYYSYFRYAYLKEGFAVPDLSGNRLQLWTMAIERWLTKPVFGTGFGELLQGWVRHAGDGQYQYFDMVYVHNLTLELLYLLGTVGFVAVIFIVVQWCKRVRWTMRLVPPGTVGAYQGLVLFCALNVLISQFGEALRYSSVGFLFWASLGLEAALAAQVQGSLPKSAIDKIITTRKMV